MFLFSKKLLYLLVIVALVFGEDAPQKGIIRCLTCGSHPYLCDGKNETPDFICDDDTPACGWKKEGDKIYKLCAFKKNLWDDGNGKPKYIPGVECWCIEDYCNAKPGFCVGDDGGSKGNGTGGGVAPIPSHFRGLSECWKCEPDTVCNANHDGAPESCSDSGCACAAVKDQGKITKFCDTNAVNWEQPDGSPKCEPGVMCYCQEDNCNKPKEFGGFKGGANGDEDLGGDGAAAREEEDDDK